MLNTLKGRQYDVLINLTEHWHGARLARRLKPRVSVGFKPDKRGAARRRWVKSFTTLYPAIQDNSRHMVEVNLDALRRIGIHPQSDKDKHTLFVPGDVAEASVAEKLAGFGLTSKSYIWSTQPHAGCLRPGYQKLAATIDNRRHAACRLFFPPHRQREGIHG